jgi:DNA-binding MarR family transcriptional regulator
MAVDEVYRHFLHHAHIFASTVREILEEKYLRQATSLEVTVPQLNLLKLIAHNGRHQVGELASFLGVSQAAASKNVDKLVRLKLITREVQQSDRRAASLSLTSRGKSVIHKYESLKEEKLKKILESLPPEDLSTLMQGLEKVAHLILEKELDRNRCMRCSAYYVKSCRLKPICGECLYLQTRERSHTEPVAVGEAGR